MYDSLPTKIPILGILGGYLGSGALTKLWIFYGLAKDRNGRGVAQPMDKDIYGTEDRRRVGLGCFCSPLQLRGFHPAVPQA